MTKMKRAIVGAAAALTLAVGAATCVLIMGQKQSAVAEDGTKLLTELKVGKYYLQDGTDEEYIEVYSDQTICLFGYTLPDDAPEIRRENLKKFTTRKYYALSDMANHIGLGDTLTPDNWRNTGYSYLGENTICFSTPEGTLNYIYRTE